MNSRTYSSTLVAGGLLPAILLLSGTAASATVLDDFNDNIKTGWTDTLNGGVVTETSQQLQIRTALAAGSVSSARKTSEAFVNAAGRTLELRVDVAAASPADSNLLAVLAWVPTGGTLFANGYSISAGARDVKLQKGGATLWSTNFTAGIQSSNTTLALRMTPSGSALTVNARVYKQTGSQVLQNYTVLAEYTATDAAGLIGTAGHAALGAVNQASATGVSVTFDNLQVFELNNGTLDNFNTADGLSGWNIAKKRPDDYVTEAGGRVTCGANIAPNGGFATAYNTSKTFKIVDGSRVEFRVTVVQHSTLDNTYSLLGYLPSPGAGDANVYSLILYHIADKDPSGAGGSTKLANGKNYNGWWSFISPSIPAPDGTRRLRYSLAMTGEGSNCRVETRIEDLSLDINDPGRVAYQNVFVDSPAEDLAAIGQSEISDAPYLNVNGNFTIGTFNDGLMAGATEVIFDDAEYGETIPENSDPSIQNLFPPYQANFAFGASAVTFNVLDDTNTPIDNIELTLNGVLYKNGSPGVTITGTAQNRLFTLTGVLTPNVNYVGSIKATDNVGASVELDYVFDTFHTNNLVVESEEYNFTTDFGTNVVAGQFFDAPWLVSEGTSDYEHAYNHQVGTPEIDYHDNRSFPNGFSSFRLYDNVRITHGGDPLRAKYVLAGGTAAGFYEHVIEDIYDGDWLNYTKTFAAGTYRVYLRQSQYLLPRTLVTLEQVTSDRTQGNQTTKLLGSFVGSISGLDRYANVPLTDAGGQEVVVRFTGGPDTLRVQNRVTGNADDEVGILLQNYLVFVPVANPGTLRPVVAMATPLFGATVDSVSPVVTASIVSRDTSVNVGSVQLSINGSPVAATVTPTANGADVNYAMPAPLPLPGLVTSALIYQDSQNEWQTNTWTWTLTYPFLRAANSLPAGALTLRGWELRMVQTNGPTLGNNLVRPEQQLAIPPEIPYEATTQTVWQVLNWNDAGDGTTAEDFGYFTGATGVPGLPPDGSHDNIACEMFAYLELTAGVHRFGAISDDGFLVRSGSGLRDSLGTTLKSRDGTFNGTFDFVVEASGLYPVRCLWYENGGAARFQLFSVDLGNPEARVLVNNPANPAGTVKAWLPYGLLSATSVDGPFTGATGHVINPATKTITVPRSGATQFYRVLAFDPVNPNYQPSITHIQVDPTVVTIHYE